MFQFKLLVMAAGTTTFPLGSAANYLLVFAFAMVAAGAIYVILRVVNLTLRQQLKQSYLEKGIQEPEAFAEESDEEVPSRWSFSNIMKAMTRAVPVEREEEITFHHSFDGIRELDNKLPPWWVWMFYVTIAWALAYLVYYHVTGSGMSSKEEYEFAMASAEEEVAAYRAQMADLINEGNVQVVTDPAVLADAKALFTTSCVSCHGAMGEGGIGPNLTDDYWIHGGGIQNIFKTIKYGVPEKGMIAWKDQLGAQDMQKLASYILTLHGTNPPNGKAPQGDLWQEGGQAPAGGSAQPQ